LLPFTTALRTIQNRIQELQRKISELENEQNNAKQLLEQDFGPNGEFYPLKGQCASADTPEYTYEVCSFDKVSQNSKSGGGSTNLGRWSDSDNQEWKDTHLVMKYTGGTRCWGGPDRSATMEVFCDVETRVANPSEPNKCEYKMQFFTPAACSEKRRDELASLLKSSGVNHDEL